MLEPVPLPALCDNYIWLFRRADDPAAIVVDPGEAAPVLDAIAAEGIALAAIFITHHHGDHVGGLAEVSQAFPEAPVYGPADESVRGVTHAVCGGERVRVDALDADFEILDTPGHTAGHIAYHGGGVLACGDTLFAAGCGRVFEGTPEQMAESLHRLAALPDATLGCCGHEYTIANLRFAQAVEPDNPDVATRLQWAEEARAANRPTLPFRLADERATNPFLRCDQPDVRAAAEQRAGRALGPASEVFAVLRAWKNEF